jgi:small conductance mechanosensitive channel
MPPSHRQSLAYALLVVVGLSVAGVVLYYEATIAHLFPASLAILVRVALTLVVGIAAILAVQKILSGVLSRHVGMRRASLAISFFELGSYSILALAVLLAAGVSSLAVLAGGTFAGLVIGLAGQTVLSNVIAGILLLFVRPLEPGERVTITTWQYALVAPSYPPKFYSQDTVIPGYTGIVQDVGIVYSSMRLDDGTELRLPNSILIQAAVLSHELTERWVRIKYEIPPNLDPGPILKDLGVRLPVNTWVVRPELLRTYLTSVTLSSSVITVDAVCRGNLEDPPRSSILLDIRAAVETAKADAAAAGTGPGSRRRASPTG